MKKIMFLLMMFVSVLCYSQTEAEKGSYQFIYTTQGAEENVQLTSTQLEKIDELRQKTEPVYVYVSPNIIVKIHSEKYLSEMGLNDEVLYLDRMREDIKQTRYIGNL